VETTSRRRRAGLALAVALAGGALGHPAAGGPEDAPPAAAPSASDWLADAGTAVLGLGLLRVAPSTPAAAGSVRVRYRETPTDYAAFDSIQLMVLPGGAFAEDGRCFADRALAFGKGAAGAPFEVVVEVPVTAPALWIVGYGPFFGPDTGRPLSLTRALSLEVKDAKGATWRWVDERAGELNAKGWTNRPEVRRGGPVRVEGQDHWFEVRPLVVYDRERVRAPGDPETAATLAVRREAASLSERAKALGEQGKADAARDLEAEAADLLANVDASDDRLPVPAATAERFRRLPFRWK
jgi:hypothetical protein